MHTLEVGDKEGRHQVTAGIAPFPPHLGTPYLIGLGSPVSHLTGTYGQSTTTPHSQCSHVLPPVYPQLTCGYAVLGTGKTAGRGM